MTTWLAWALLLALDGGAPGRDAGVPLTDAEVIAELELLEHLEGLRDLELFESLDLAR